MTKTNKQTNKEIKKGQITMTSDHRNSMFIFFIFSKNRKEKKKIEKSREKYVWNKQKIKSENIT